MTTITRHRHETDGHEEPIEAFFARRSRRSRMQLAPFGLDHDQLLADLDPDRLTWRDAGCPSGPDAEAAGF